jgi:hypothetical protein
VPITAWLPSELDGQQHAQQQSIQFKQRDRPFLDRAISQRRKHSGEQQIGEEKSIEPFHRVNVRQTIGLP